MLDDIAFLDDATRPEAPKFDNLTLAQRAPGRHLAMIHSHFRQNMQTLRDAIDAAADGTLPADELHKQAEDLEILQNYRRFGALCGQHCQIIHTHHSIEDAHIFPEMSAKSAALKKVVDRLIAEHEIVHELLTRLVGAIGRLIESPGAGAFAEARELYDALERVLLSHFGYEEESIGDAMGYYGIGA